VVPKRLRRASGPVKATDARREPCRSGSYSAGVDFAGALVRGLVAFALGASGEVSVAATPLTSAVAAGSDEYEPGS
jgi:hypothetical protein